MNAPIPEHDLDWQAQQYVLGELPAEDVERFETLLMESQPAREAVAQAGELMLVVRQVSEATTTAKPPRTSAWKWIAATAATAAAVTVAFFAGKGFAPQASDQPEIAGDQPKTPTVASSPAEAERLIDVYSASAPLVAMNEEAVDPTEETTGEPGEYSVPSWMLSAVNPEADPGENEHEEEWD